MLPVICERCGFQWALKSSRQKSVLCKSCRAKRTLTVHTDNGKVKCLPWGGMFLSEVYPIRDDGTFILPGVRRCGNTDCVNASHVVPPDADDIAVQ